MVGRVGNRSLCVVMVWMPALYSCFVPPYDLGRTAMQLLAWSAIEMNKCRWMKLTCKDVEQDAMQHRFPDWYFPSFTLTQKTSAWPSDCIHADFHVFCSDVKNEQINYFNERLCERSECETWCVSDTCEYGVIMYVCIYVDYEYMIPYVLWCYM